MNGSEKASLPLLVLATVSITACIGPLPRIDVLRAPEGASLPQLVIGTNDTLQLVYYTGSMSSGDLFHATRTTGATEWSTPQRVNSQPHSVTGLGPIDGGQLAIGPDGLLHVTWFHKAPTRFYYTRSNDTGAFETQRSLSINDEGGVEAGSAVTVDPDGNVYVFWHAGPVQDAQRRVYMTVSAKNEKLFEPPRAISPPSEGACGCCGLRAISTDTGTIHLSYRGAGNNLRRGMRLLTSIDHGRTFTDQLIQPWEIGACPVTTTTLSAGPNGAVVAWETAGQVYVANTARLEQPTSLPAPAVFRRKNATVSVNHHGDTLLAWGDGPGWQSGGTLHWQLFDNDGHPWGDEGSTAAPIPARSVPTIAARSDGSFVLVY